jgi:AraC-like DNA-binding protein
VIGIDFALYKGIHAPNIIAIGYFIILPLLSITVVIASLNMVSASNEEEIKQQDKTVPSNDITYKKGELKKQGAPLIVNSASTLTDAQITDIVNKVDQLITTKQVFLDPDLTLDRLARKVGIPARKISLSVNHVYGRNISQVINEYRIERAKQLLINTDKSITQIYFDSGFQTKSNFNREFARLTEQTPSAFRRSHLQQK